MADINILQNPDLNHGFSPYKGDARLFVPTNWAPWWQEGSEHENRPEWKSQKPDFDRFEVDDTPLCRIQSPYATHIGGLYQQIPAVSGEKYELTVESMAWSSEAIEQGEILNPADVNVQIGIDPTGGTDGNSPIIEWSTAAQPINKWSTLRQSVIAQHAIITIFLRSAPNFPKRQQMVFWRRAYLSPTGRYKRTTNIVGSGDTHIAFDPERPRPEHETGIIISSLLPHKHIELQGTGPENEPFSLVFVEETQIDDRYFWRYNFTPVSEGLYDFRFLTDGGARILSQRLVRIANAVQIVPSGRARTEFNRVYVLLPPTADETWLLAAARGGFEGRYTIGFSADDAGIGRVADRKVIAINPHHWPETLTSAWYQQHYPGTTFIPLVANSPADLEAWLKDWIYE